MKRIHFGIYEVELINDSSYSAQSADNVNTYDFVYIDKGESQQYRMIQHGINVYEDDRLYKSAIVCASGGATGIFENSYLLDEKSILICCANCLFCLSLPNLELNWVTQVDLITCFGVYKAEEGFFTHGEIEISRLNKLGKVLWHQGFADILVNVDSSEPNFILQEDHIDLRDFRGNKYKLDFDGNII